MYHSILALVDAGADLSVFTGTLQHFLFDFRTISVFFLPFFFFLSFFSFSFFLLFFSFFSFFYFFLSFFLFFSFFFQSCVNGILCRVLFSISRSAIAVAVTCAVAARAIRPGLTYRVDQMGHHQAHDSNHVASLQGLSGGPN
jgi:hypothetical protein